MRLFRAIKIPAGVSGWVSRPETGRVLLGALLIFTLALLFLTEAVRAKTENPIQHQPSGMEVQRENVAAYPTPLVPNDRDQTNGLVIGGVLLVLIIIIGTLWTIRRSPEDGSS